MRHFALAALSFPLVAALAGCPDPTATTDGTATNQQAPGTPGAPPPSGEGGTANPAPAGAGRPTPPGFGVKAGEGVKLSGKVEYSGSKTGTIHVDFLKPPVNGALPELLDSLELKELGAWEIEAPKNAGDLAIVAYIDSAGDGPSDGDPAARVTGVVTVKDAAVGSLDLTLSDSPDLGDLKPGQPGALPNAAPPPKDPGAAAPTPATPPTGAPGVPGEGAATDAAKPAEGDAAPAAAPAAEPATGAK